MKIFNTYFAPMFMVLFCALFLAGCHTAIPPVAIYENATIYTCDDSLPQAQAMVVQDGKILYIGSNSGATKYKNGTSTVVNMQGKTILPGLIESHVHLAISGLLQSAGMLPLGDMTVAEVQAALRNYLSQHPDAKHILGMGYSLGDLGLPKGTLPTTKELDEVSSDIPILLLDEGGHSSWANSKALEIAKIDENTPELDPGVSFFVRDPETNKPTGYIYEKTTFLMLSTFPILETEKVSTGISNMLNSLSAMGFTGLFDAGGFFDIEYDALAKIQADGNLNFYYQKSHIVEAGKSPTENLERLKMLDKKYTKGHLYCNIYKLFEDGTVEVETAALIDPYTSSGKMANTYVTDEQAVEHARVALSGGYAIHTHAIGDKAQRAILNAYLATKNINPELTRTIAHNQVFEPEALKKYEEMKPFLTCQSTPSWTQPSAAKLTKEKLGEQRFGHQYLWGQLMAEGVNVTFGSDFPANPFEAINPFFQMSCAVTRNYDNTFFPPREAGVTIEQALKAYTINGARQMMIDDITGSLKAGKFADFIVVDRDIMKIAPQDIQATQVEQTYFQGKLVY